MSPALLLVAHGSRDPRSAVATRALARAVAARLPTVTVRYGFLDLSEPRTGPVLERLAARGHREVVAMPLLLTAAYHSRVDLPAVLAAAPPGLVVRRADVLGPDPRLLDALTRRLAPVIAGLGTAPDGVVLAAAGSSDPGATAMVGEVAVALGERLGVPARAGFAAAQPGVGEAVRALRARGAERIAMASWFLAPGLLYDRAVAAASGAGAVAFAGPLVAAPELVEVVRHRYLAVAGSGPETRRRPGGSPGRRRIGCQAVRA